MVTSIQQHPIHLHQTHASALDVEIPHTVTTDRPQRRRHTHAWGGGPMHMQTVQINNVCMSRPTQHEKQETAKPWRQNKTFAQTFASTDTDQVLWNQS